MRSGGCLRRGLPPPLNRLGSFGVSGGYNLAFAATRFAASTWPRGPETPDSCHNCMSHQELGLLWAIHPPETLEEPSLNRL